jgi:hypothetical protein
VDEKVLSETLRRGNDEASTEGRAGAFSIEFRMALLGPQESMKMGVGVTRRERKRTGIWNP